MRRLVLIASCVLVACSSSNGARGEPGTPGSNGTDGAMGSVGLVGGQGAKGTMGDRGDTGPKGARGPAGPKGDTGAQGNTGAPGASVVLASEPIASSNCVAGGVRISVGASTEYACSGLPGSLGAKGDQGLKGDKGDKGDTGQPGAFHLLDGNDTLLGTLVPAAVPAGGGLMVRTPEGVFIQYDVQTGKAGEIFDGSGSSATLYFASADCSGTALTQATKLVGAGIFNAGTLYVASLPYATVGDLGSEKSGGGACSSTSPGPRNLLVADPVGPAPVDAVLPLQIQ